MSGVHSAAEISEVSQHLGAVEDWLAEKCEARNAGNMADIVGRAVTILEDYYDEQREKEAS